jgi:hypothetical protein
MRNLRVARIVWAWLSGLIEDPGWIRGTSWLPSALTVTDDEPPELAFYCPDCAEREFGGD